MVPGKVRWARQSRSAASRIAQQNLVLRIRAIHHWSQVAVGTPPPVVHAMVLYTKAESIRPPGNDDALLRWNACARALNANPELHPRPVEDYESVLDD